MVYRFDEDDHGEVVSEACADDLPPYLGLHFPESDIPRQARELYRRSGGRTPPLDRPALVALYEEALGDVRSVRDFRAAALRLDLGDRVPAEERERLFALPDLVEIRDKAVGIEYDVEARDGEPVGVARLVLPEKLARTVVEEELPSLDRPIRFVVYRGQRGSVRADTLGELQHRLELPWAPGERDVGRPERSDDRGSRRQDRDGRRPRGEPRRRGDGARGGARGGPGRAGGGRRGSGAGRRRSGPE